MKFTDRRSRRNSQGALFNDEFGLHLVKDIETVVDIGANVGVVAVRSRFQFPKARVLAFEPCAKARYYLEENCLSLNIEVHPDALGDGKEHGFQSKGCTSVSKLNDASEDKIQTYTLPQLFERHGIPVHRTFVKVDIEGAEWCLPGDEDAEAILKECALVHIECHKSTRASLAEYRQWGTELFLDSHYVNYVTGRIGHLTCIKR
jgi:FkbM family methyltransferase